jgi:hypothetical protein
MRSSWLPDAEVDDARMILWDVASWHRLYLVAKPFHVGGRCGWASLPSAPSYDLQSPVEGIELPIRRCLVPSCGSWCWHLWGGGFIALGLGYLMECWPSGYLCYRILHGANHFYQGTLILCQSHNGVYVYILGWATTSGSDGMDSSTWVDVVRCVWGPLAMSHHARCLVPPLPKAAGVGNAYPLLKALGHVDRMPGPCPGSRREVGWEVRWLNLASPCLS